MPKYQIMNHYILKRFIKNTKIKSLQNCKTKQAIIIFLFIYKYVINCIFDIIFLKNIKIINIECLIKIKLFYIMRTTIFLK